MALTVEAVYENGMLQLPQPLPLKDHQKVRVTIHILAEEDRARKTYGLLGWTGDSETVQRAALDPDLDPLESP
jgi:predicted DNA-binding antitoxin AbrB/MazE fold protein